MCEVDETQLTNLLRDLEIDTARLSFGWLLEDDENGILQWFYENISTANVLTKSENQRYNELMKSGYLNDQYTEKELSEIMHRYNGLVCPTEIDQLADLENEIKMLRDKLCLVNKQNKNMDRLENIIGKALSTESQELKKLHNEQLVVSVDRSAAVKECIELANNIEVEKNKLTSIVHKTLDFYNNSLISSNTTTGHLLACGPVEKYLQNRNLFQSYVKVCTAEFSNLCLNSINSNGNIHTDISFELNKLAEKLHSSVIDYIDHKAKHRAVSMQLLENPEKYNTSQLNLDIAKCQSTIALLNTDLELLKKQGLFDDIDRFVDEQCHLVWQGEGKRLLEERRSIYSRLCSLMDYLQEMMNLDDLLYFGMKRNCTMVEDAIQFDIDVNNYIEEEKSKSKVRVDFMKSVLLELLPSNNLIERSNPIVKIIQNMLISQKDEKTVSQLMMQLMDRQRQIEESQKDVVMQFSKIEEKQALRKSSMNYIHKFIWDGHTKQPNLFNLSVLSLLDNVKEQKANAEKMIREIVKLFTKQKDDKAPNSPLWILFLTDERKLHHFMEKAKEHNPEYRPFK